MKTATRLLIALCLGAVLQTSTFAQLPPVNATAKIIPAGMPKGGVKMTSDVEKILVSNKWEWVPSHGRVEKIEFKQNREFWCHVGWFGRVSVKNLKEFEIKADKNKGSINHGSVKLTFNDDYSAFEGMDMWSTPIRGYIVITPAK